MAPKKKDNPNRSPRIENRKAWHDFHILDKLECGIVLQGSEVKAIRTGSVSLGEGFAKIEPASMEIFLWGVNIAPFAQAKGVNGHEPTRTRKLLAHRREINKLLTLTTAKGVALVPLAMYFVRGKVKVEIGVGQGKKAFDKRQDIKKRDTDREMRRAMTKKVL